jgi:hypothetical protein
LIPSVRSSPESISEVLITTGPSGSSSMALVRAGPYKRGQKVAGSAGGVYSLDRGSEGVLELLASYHVLFKIFLYRMVKACSTTWISALLLLMVSEVGSDIECKVSTTPPRSWNVCLTLFSSWIRSLIRYYVEGCIFSLTPNWTEESILSG